VACSVSYNDGEVAECATFVSPRPVAQLPADVERRAGAEVHQKMAARFA